MYGNDNMLYKKWWIFGVNKIIFLWIKFDDINKIKRWSTLTTFTNVLAYISLFIPETNGIVYMSTVINHIG